MNKMLEIPKIENKSEALSIYLQANKNDDEDDSWVFGHNPTIINFLGTFSVEDYEKLKLEIENWSDEVVCNLADPIGECSNKIIDSGYIYCKIFIQINHLEKLEYLIENLAPYAWGIKGNYSQKFYERLLQKAMKINELRNNNFNYTIEQIKRKKIDENKA